MPIFALMASPPLTFLAKLSIIDEVALVTNCDKISLAKVKSGFMPKLPIILPRNSPD